ncbi:50S ribosomal protein L33 [Lacrimispora sp.]|nr:50S ribosomal protein L33 [Lacrimispora sp.]
MRVKVTLECTECHDRNYTITKNKQKHPERMEIMKYCPRLKKYTLHKETK